MQASRCIEVDGCSVSQPRIFVWFVLRFSESEELTRCRMC